MFTGEGAFECFGQGCVCGRGVVSLHIALHELYHRLSNSIR